MHGCDPPSSFPTNKLISDYQHNPDSDYHRKQEIKDRSPQCAPQRFPKLIGEKRIRRPISGEQAKNHQSPPIHRIIRGVQHPPDRHYPGDVLPLVLNGSAADCFVNCAAELIGVSGGSDNGLGIIAGSLLIVLINLDSDSGMRVEQVVVILKCGLDLCLGLSVGAAASPEQLADLRLYISGDLVPSIGLELAEPVR